MTYLVAGLEATISHRCSLNLCSLELLLFFLIHFIILLQSNIIIAPLTSFAWTKRLLTKLKTKKKKSRQNINKLADNLRG